MPQTQAPLLGGTSSLTLSCGNKQAWGPDPNLQIRPRRLEDHTPEQLWPTLGAAAEWEAILPHPSIPKDSQACPVWSTEAVGPPQPQGEPLLALHIAVPLGTQRMEHRIPGRSNNSTQGSTAPRTTLGTQS